MVYLSLCLARAVKKAMSPMAANLARNKHYRLQRAELAVCKRKLGVSERDHELMVVKLKASERDRKHLQHLVNDLKFRTMERVNELARAKAKIQALREKQALDKATMDGLKLVADVLAVSLIRHTYN